VAEDRVAEEPGENLTAAAGPGQAAQIDTTVAHPARVYDYWLGGKNNFPADREAAERVLAVTPGLRFRVRANRAFLARACGTWRPMRDPAVPRCRHRNTLGEQHTRGSPGGRAGLADRLRGQRSLQAGLCTRAGPVRLLPQASTGAGALRASLSAPQLVLVSPNDSRGSG